MKKVCKIFLVIQVGLTSMVTSCKKKQNFTKVDESFNMVIKEEQHQLVGLKTINTVINDYNELYCDKLEVIDLLNNVTDCKYNPDLRASSINGETYNTYFVSFTKEDAQIEFRFDSWNRTYISDTNLNSWIEFDNNKYRYSCLNQLRDKVLNLLDTVSDEHKEVSEKSWLDN